MSLSRASPNDISKYIQDKCSAILGNKFWDCRTVLSVECGTKPDRLEPRIIVISKFRLFVLNGRTAQSLKVDRYFHVLSIRSIQLINDNEVCFGLDESMAGKRRLFVHMDGSSRGLAINVLSAIKHYFPDFNDLITSMIEIIPADLYNEFANLPIALPLLACRSFRRTYAALCDYHEQPFREEVVWDIEKIYAVHRVKVLRLEDFTHLLPRDLVPIIAVCQYSTFFTGLSVDSTKLGPEIIEILLSVVRRSRTIASLSLRNCSLPRDFISLFSAALQSNVSIPLEVLDFSRNSLEDKKGFTALSALVPKLSNLRSIALADCLLSEKCINMLAAGLMQGVMPNTGHLSQFVLLDLSKNTLKEDVSDLMQFLSLCESLRTLNLSDSGFSVDKLWGTLRYGGLQLEVLKLAGCQCNRRNKEGMQHMKEYFSSAVGLTYIDFSNTSLGPDMLKQLFLGLASNQQLKPFTLLLDGIGDKGIAQVLESSLGDIDAKNLSLRDLNLEADALPILTACSEMPHLIRLDLSGVNFIALKKSAKHHATLTNVILEIIKLVGEEDSRLNDLILCDCRLGTHLSVLLNTLGVSSSLQYLDITGNEMGNFGARLLAKALQVNTSIRTLLLDRNQITGDGFADIAQALTLNTTLTSLPYPIGDAADALNRADRFKTLNALSEIESSVERNRSGAKKGEDSYRTMLSSLQQELFGKSDNNWKSAELSEKFLAAIEMLPGICEKDDQLNVISDQSISILEEKTKLIAKASLASIVKVAESENIEYNYHIPERNVPLREAVISATVNYLSELKWKILGKTVEQILVELRTLDISEDRQSLSSSRNLPAGSPHELSQGQSSPRQPSLGSPRDFLASISVAAQRLHKTVTPESEVSEKDVNLEAPPLPSQLTHVIKSRPKPQRGAKINLKTGDSDEQYLSEKSSGSSSAPTPDEKMPVAMPRSTSIQTPSLGFPTPNSPSSSTPPPIVPRRNRVGPLTLPPSLPPKPEPTLPSFPKPETPLPSFPKPEPPSLSFPKPEPTLPSFPRPEPTLPSFPKPETSPLPELTLPSFPKPDVESCGSAKPTTDPPSFPNFVLPALSSEPIVLRSVSGRSENKPNQSS